jgi:hypothetical protein
MISGDRIEHRESQTSRAYVDGVTGAAACITIDAERTLTDPATSFHSRALANERSAITRRVHDADD